MEEPDFSIFSSLYHQACLHCFKQPLSHPLTEAESKLFYQQILDRTGLTVGWRSLKNYSFFVLGSNPEGGNPSIASMDTLARYVLQAPYTNEVARKNQESHHPYWFMYRERQLAAGLPAAGKHRMHWMIKAAVIVLTLAGILIWRIYRTETPFEDSFNDLSERGLNKRGWRLMDKDSVYWAMRGKRQGSLTLFTLPGDNWPDGKEKPQIKNLLIRPIASGCFTTELELRDFVPAGEWQQAGLLLLKDTSLNSPSIRMSLAFNDLFGGYKKGKEVLVQAIFSTGAADKPEEFAHVPVLTSDSTVKSDGLLLKNLAYSALRIEKSDKQYRFLYAGGAVDNAAFKQIAVKEFPFEPRYIALFAIKGRGTSTQVKEVAVKRFAFKYHDCE